MPLSIESSAYGVTKDVKTVEKYTLRNNNQVEVTVITYGGIITSFVVPDHNGNPVDIVLGYDTLDQYEACGISMGCLVGRFANRIAGAAFVLDGKGYQLEANNNGHHLHGGSQGFNKVVWKAEIDRGDSTERTPPVLILRHVSEDGQGGYPGTLSVQVSYSLTDKNELIINYTASTDKPTVVNLTSHAYFNLKGHQQAGTDGILDQHLLLAADQFIPTTNEGVPLSNLSDVQSTPMDFRKGAVIGENIAAEHQQLTAGAGFDHTWVIADHRDHALSFAARLSDPGSGRSLEVHTTQPGVQFYTANHVHDCAGKSGARYQQHGSLCLEAQHFPNSPNRPDFPTTALRPGEKLEETTIYHAILSSELASS